MLVADCPGIQEAPAMQSRGEEVHGEVHSSDASSGVEIVIYDQGGGVARALEAAERLVITDALIVSENGGDCAMFLDADDDNALDAGETVIRGTVTDGGGIGFPFVGTHRMGQPGAKPHYYAPSGESDAIFTGYIIKA
jgi:hypothetical protein